MNYPLFGCRPLLAPPSEYPQPAFHQSLHQQPPSSQPPACSQHPPSDTTTTALRLIVVSQLHTDFLRSSQHSQMSQKPTPSLINVLTGSMGRVESPCCIILDQPSSIPIHRSVRGPGMTEGVVIICSVSEVILLYTVRTLDRTLIVLCQKWSSEYTPLTKWDDPFHPSMEKEPDSLKTSDNDCLNYSPNSHSTVDTLQEPFLIFDPTSELSFKSQSTYFCSLLALVKAEHPFNNALQDKTTQFLKSLEPTWRDTSDYADKLLTDLVPSSTGSLSGFVASIFTLLSSPHSTVVTATLSFLMETTRTVSPSIRCRLVESDLITNLLATVQPHTLPIAGNEMIIMNLVRIIDSCINLTSPRSLKNISVTTAVDLFNHREMIFQKVVLPSSQFVTFLISNRSFIEGSMAYHFIILLGTFILKGPYHRPILEYIITSPIVTAFSSCLSFIEDNSTLANSFFMFDNSLREWTEEGAEVIQSWIWMMRALFSEGFEDSAEQIMKHEDGVTSDFGIVAFCQLISGDLGWNAKKPRLSHLK